MDCGFIFKLDFEWIVDCWIVEEVVFIGRGSEEWEIGLGCLEVCWVEKLGGGGGGGIVFILKLFMFFINFFNLMMLFFYCNVYIDRN